MSIERYYLLILLLVPILFSISIPSAFAQTVSLPVGSSVPGCEKTNECYIPATITVGVGETVTWINDDTAAHTVTSGYAGDGPDGKFDSGMFLSGATFSWTAKAAGEYPYFCIVHPWMTGTVIVKETPSSGIVDTVDVVIPSWIKDVAGFWCEDEIDDASFIEAIQYLINNDVIIDPTTTSSGSGVQEIPNWVKSNACWWSQGLISNSDFASGLQYLIGQGIIRV